ncbi:MAG: hypothetical protein JW714_02465 [Candidatus Omnitrophica bacterium]|nr:hypothetical protein [Candidatus Omnitrophota bacterium]
MIEIDLLPLQFRDKKHIAFETIFKKKMLIIIFGCLVSLHLLIIMATLFNAGRLNKFTRRWQGLSSKKEQVNQVKNRLNQINQKIPLIEQLINERVLWSKKLNGISDLIAGGIWLNELSLEEKSPDAQGNRVQYLVLKGSAASQTKDEPALIGRFMQNLKNEPCFSEDFSEIELGPIKKRQIKQTEVMDFILFCRFKK